MVPGGRFGTWLVESGIPGSWAPSGEGKKPVVRWRRGTPRSLEPFNGDEPRACQRPTVGRCCTRGGRAVPALFRILDPRLLAMPFVKNGVFAGCISPSSIGAGWGEKTLDYYKWGASPGNRRSGEYVLYRASMTSRRILTGWDELGARKFDDHGLLSALDHFASTSALARTASCCHSTRWMISPHKFLNRVANSGEYFCPKLAGCWPGSVD